MANREGSRLTAASLQTGQATRPFFFWLANAVLSSNHPSKVCPFPQVRS